MNPDPEVLKICSERFHGLEIRITKLTGKVETNTAVMALLQGLTMLILVVMLGVTLL